MSARYLDFRSGPSLALMPGDPFDNSNHRHEAVIMLRSITGVITALVIAAPLSAQAPRKGIAEVSTSQRGGFWGSIGFGAGMERVNLQDDGRGFSDPLWRPTMNLRLGGTVGQHVRVGGEAFVWWNSNGGVTETLVSVMPIVQLYPARTTGFHFRGGAGFARSGLTDFTGFTVADYGFAAMAGVGWELPVSRTVFLTPTVDWNQQWYDGGFDPGYTERIINFGLSIGFQAR